MINNRSKSWKTIQNDLQPVTLSELQLVQVHGTCPCHKIKNWANQRQRPEFFVLVHREKQDGSIVQHCLLVACPIELDYPWNEQSVYVSGYHSKKYDRSLQSVSLENQPQPILLRCTLLQRCSTQSMLGITKTMHHAVSQFTRGDMLHPSTFACVCKSCYFAPARRPC